MALTDLTRISTSGIATGTSLSGAILHGDAHFRGTQVGVTSALFDSSDDALEFNDNVKLKFGNSGDLELYHDPTGNSYIKETGGGSLVINADDFYLQNVATTTFLRTQAAGSIEINFNGNKKFETTNHGAVVTGILTATGFSGPTNNTSGIATFYDLRVSNNLTVEGTTTTLDTNLIGVDRIEVGADSNTVVGVAITQSGTADIVNLFDGASQVVTVDDVGNVGIGTDNPQSKIHISGTGANEIRIDTSGTGISFYDHSEFIGFIGNDSGKFFINAGGTQDTLSLKTNGTERLSINSVGNLEQTLATNAQGFKQINANNHYIYNIIDANRSAANDHLLVQQGRWNGKNVAAIKFRAGSDTSNKDDGYITFETSTANNQSEKLRIDSAGNVGLGTITASDSTGNCRAYTFARTDVNGQVRIIMKNQGTGFGNGAGYHQGIDGSNVFIENRSNGGYLSFSTNGGSNAERLRITSGGTLESYSTNDTTPNIKWRSDDTNWFGALNQSVHGGTITSFLSCGGDWSADGTTYSATKALAAYPTSAIAVHNQYNNNWGTEFVFLTKAGGSSTTDGTVSERLRIDSSGRTLINTTAVTNTNDTLTVKRAAGSFTEMSMTVDANTATGTHANAFVFTKSKNTYWNGLGFQSSHGHVGAIVGMRDSTAMNTSHKIRIEIGGTGINASEEKTWDFLNTGDLSISDGNLVVASGHGIDFSVTGDASGMSSELLHDYEEGTWTPTAYGFTISSTYSARYTKIGRLVHINCYVQAATGNGVSQQPQINGLPFTSVGGNTYSYGAGRLGTGGYNNSQVDIAFQQQNSSTSVKFYVGGGGINESMMSGGHVIFSMVYEAA